MSVWPPLYLPVLMGHQFLTAKLTHMQLSKYRCWVGGLRRPGVASSSTQSCSVADHLPAHPAICCQVGGLTPFSQSHYPAPGPLMTSLSAAWSLGSLTMNPSPAPASPCQWLRSVPNMSLCQRCCIYLFLSSNHSLLDFCSCYSPI